MQLCIRRLYEALLLNLADQLPRPLQSDELFLTSEHFDWLRQPVNHSQFAVLSTGIPDLGSTVAEARVTTAHQRLERQLYSSDLQLQSRTAVS